MELWNWTDDIGRNSSLLVRAADGSLCSLIGPDNAAKREDSSVLQSPSLQQAFWDHDIAYRSQLWAFSDLQHPNHDKPSTLRLPLHADRHQSARHLQPYRRTWGWRIKREARGKRVSWWVSLRNDGTIRSDRSVANASFSANVNLWRLQRRWCSPPWSSVPYRAVLHRQQIRHRSKDRGSLCLPYRQLGSYR